MSGGASCLKYRPIGCQVGVGTIPRPAMCNAYRISPKKSSSGFAARVSEAAAGLASPLVRKSDPCVVLLEDTKVEVMRWGFIRPFNRAINVFGRGVPR